MSELHFPPQGGSFGRGTDLRGICDVELVVFYKALGDFKGQRSRQAEVLRDMQTQLQAWCQDPAPGLSLRFAEQNRPNALQLQLVSTDPSSWVDVSVLPTLDAVGKTVAGPQRIRNPGTGRGVGVRAPAYSLGFTLEDLTATIKQQN